MSTPTVTEPPGGTTRPGFPPALSARGRGVLRGLPQPSPITLWTLGLGLLLAAIAMRAGGGLQLGRSTEIEMAVQITGGTLGALAVLATGDRRLHGLWSLVAFGALAGLTAASVWWAVNPSDAWLEANRTMAYAAAFAAGLALARLVPERWGVIIGATVVCATVVSGYALLTKILPGTFAPDEVFARLREPFGYWNAVGLMAALGVPGALWLAARRHGHAAVSALAYPVLGLLLVTILLAYSRGSLLAVAVGVGIWFTCVPLRLRGVAALAAGAVGAGLVSSWVFAQDALTKDEVPLDVRASAGHQLGIALGAMLVLLMIVGLAVLFFAARRSPSPDARRTAGIGILVALAIVPVVLTAGLALSEKGLGGSISSGWTSLTDPDAKLPANDPGRLTAVGSVRARYWDQAIKIFRARKVQGVGAGGYATARPRFRTDDLAVRHAHGYVVQTAADLGLLGLAASLALLATWLAATLRTLGVRDRRWRSTGFDAERVGLFTLAAIVSVFAVHSLVDFTWFVPGVAVPALLCCGWLAGRGPREQAADRTLVMPAVAAGGRPHPAGLPATAATSPAMPAPAAPAPRPSVRDRVRAGSRDRTRLAGAAAVAVFALVAAWATWQPERSFHTGNEALALLDAGKIDAAREKAIDARDLNPLSVEPLFERSAIELAAGRKEEARAALEEAVRLQPSNPTPWIRLAEFQLLVAGDARTALDVLGPALYLDPRSTAGVSLFLEAKRRTAGAVTGAPGVAPGTPGTPPVTPVAPVVPPAATVTPAAP